MAIVSVRTYRTPLVQQLVGSNTLLQGTRDSVLTMLPQLTADTGGGYSLSSSSLWGNPPYWQKYYPFGADDNGSLIGVADQSNAGMISNIGLPQWLQIILPDPMYVYKVAFCWTRNDQYCTPPKSISIILDDTTTISKDLGNSYSLGQTIVYVLTINQAFQKMRFQVDSIRTGGSASALYIHDISVTGCAIDKRSPSIGTFNSSLLNMTVSGSQLAFGTKSRGTGKRYFEIQNTQLGGSSTSRGPMVGVGTSAAATTGNGTSNSYFNSVEFGKSSVDLTADRNSNTSIPTTYNMASAGYFGGILCDFDAGTMGIITPNGTRIDNIYTGITPDNYYPIIAANRSLVGNTQADIFNFGSKPFNFSLPSGYTAWCTADTPAQAFNSSDKSTSIIVTNDNRTATLASIGNNEFICSSLQRSGKWYTELTITQAAAGGFYIGVAKSSVSSALPNTSGQWSYRSNSGLVADGVYQSSGGLTFSNGDRIMIAIDMGAGKLWIGLNGSWLGGANPRLGTGGMNITANTPYKLRVTSAGQVTSDSVTIQTNLMYPEPHGFDLL